MNKYRIITTRQFERAYKLARKRGYNMALLQAVVSLLAAGKPLPDKHRDHLLTGSYEGFRECHIKPDWLLIYKITEDLLILTLVDTGTHSDLF